MAKKTKAITKKKPENKQDLIFAGASHIMGVDPKKLSAAEVTAHKARALVARALGIPPNTVVIMGNVPYIDNHGRKYKLQDYAPNAQFEYDYVQIATDDAMKAIVKCRILGAKKVAKVSDGDIVDSDQLVPLCGWVIGECSPATTRMGTLKGYQNHLAQTRAENRAFEAAFGTKFRKDLYEGISHQIGWVDTTNATGSPSGFVKQVDLELEASLKPEVKIALEAGNTSAEEAVPMRKDPPRVFDPFQNAKLAIEKAREAKELEALRGRIKGSAHLKPEQVNKLLNLIDDKLGKI